MVAHGTAALSLILIILSPSLFRYVLTTQSFSFAWPDLEENPLAILKLGRNFYCGRTDVPVPYRRIEDRRERTRRLVHPSVIIAAEELKSGTKLNGHTA